MPRPLHDYEQMLYDALQEPKALLRSVTEPEPRNDAFADSPFHFIEENKAQGYQQPTMPPDPDNGFEEKLEAEGAFIINSTTYFPASKQTVTWKSMTPAERAEQRAYQQ